MHTELAHWLKQRTTSTCHRQLVVIAGPQQWGCKQAKTILHQLHFNNLVWVGQDIEAGQIDANRFGQYLGKEYEAVVYDSYAGFRANAIAALSGTITAEGVMILICPPLSLWPQYPDPQREDKISFGYIEQSTSSHFLKWLTDHIFDDINTLLIEPDSVKGTLATATCQREEVAAPFKTAEQQDAVAAIVKTVTGHRRRPLVLTADRGRGKSSALGIAAGQLLTQKCTQIIVTAPTFGTVEHVFHHAQINLSDSKLEGQCLVTENVKLEFYPVDRLLSEKTATDLLLVDEAAAIPTAQLEQIVTHYSRVTFSTTIHGYEGSGRGFELRFKKYLSNITPDWRALHMKAPIRWLPNDPLEEFWFETLLLRQIDLPEVSSQQARQAVHKTHSATELINQPHWLKQIFCLLVNAHYQTTPDDLVRMLDGPEYDIHTLSHEQTVIGVVLTVKEGGKGLIPLASDIAVGKRRVKGHLVPQSLAFEYNNSDIIGLRIKRIVRIAIHPKLQRKGLGTTLLKQLEASICQGGTDMLASSFAANAELLSFWLQNDYLPARIGRKKDASSGEHSAIVLKSLSSQAKSYSHKLNQEFEFEFSHLLTNDFKYLNAQLVLALLSSFNNKAPLSEHEQRIISQTKNGNRSLEASRLAVNKTVLNELKSRSEISQGSELLVNYILQQQDAETVCKKHNFSGKKQLHKALETSFSRLLSAPSDDATKKVQPK